jgi:hypothetical protein
MKKKLLMPALTLLFLAAGCSKSDDDNKDNDESKGNAIVFSEYEPEGLEIGEETEEFDLPEGWVGWGDFSEEFNDDFVPPPLPTREELTQKFKEKLAEMQALVGADNSKDIANIISAQVVSFNDIINTDGWVCTDGTRLKRTTLVQTVYYIYAVYSFEQNKDYYIIDQEITLPNGNLWSKKVRERKYDGRNYQSKDFYLSWLRTENWLETKRGNYLNDVVISQYSPETVNKQTTYTSSISGNIGGTVGYMGGPTATVDGGISYSISKTRNVEDINVKNYVLSNILAKDASWEWTTMKKAVQNMWANDIEDPAELATTTAKFCTSWLWIVNKPEKTDEYLMNMKVIPKYSSFSFYTERLMSYGESRNFTTLLWHEFVLTPPNRVKK